ncbi:MAG: hypothetical protein Q8N44_07090 [Rubrivivax sp.]|nr:hypothetical protein [Rubrivivax sp.]
MTAPHAPASAAVGVSTAHIESAMLSLVREVAAKSAQDAIANIARSLICLVECQMRCIANATAQKVLSKEQAATYDAALSGVMTGHRWEITPPQVSAEASRQADGTVMTRVSFDVGALRVEANGPGLRTGAAKMDARSVGALARFVAPSPVVLVPPSIVQVHSRPSATRQRITRDADGEMTEIVTEDVELGPASGATASAQAPATAEPAPGAGSSH